MSFSTEEIAEIVNECGSVPGGEMLTPREHERRHGGNAGFSHFDRASKPVAEMPVVKCRRCRHDAMPGRRCCARHLLQRRRESLAYARNVKGCKEWVPGGKGRPPAIVQSAAAAEVAVIEAMLADALEEHVSLNKRIGLLKRDLTVARRNAVRKVAERSK